MTDRIGIGRHFSDLAERKGDAPALVMGDDRRSFAEVERSANRLARTLSARGAEAGGLVGIVLPNIPDFIEIAIACWKIGAVPFPLSHRLPTAEFEALVELGDPGLVVGAYGTPFEELASDARDNDDAPLEDVPSSPWKAIGTGGSTGRPKLIVDRAGDPARAALAASAFGMRDGQAQLIAGPLYHNGPFAWGSLHLLSGGTLVLMPRFDATDYVRTVERESIGWSFVVPTMLHRIANLPPAELDRDLSSMEVLLHSAAPCPEWLKRRTIEIFGAETVWEYYGAAEVGGTMVRGDEWLAHPGTVGRPANGVEIRIRNADGADLPPGEVGEIWIKPAVPPTFTYRGADPSERDGFYSVGDLGSLDDDGYLYIADRRTDMIISGGANIYPAEVEAAILSHPAVRDVAVVGLRDDEWGQRVHAIVEADGVSTDELEQHARERLTSYKVPRSWELVDALPRDPSGKIRRSALRSERETRVR